MEKFTKIHALKKYLDQFDDNDEVFGDLEVYRITTLGSPSIKDGSRIRIEKEGCPEVILPVERLSLRYQRLEIVDDN